MRIEYIGDYKITYPWAVTPLFGAEQYFQVEKMGSPTGWEDGTKKTMTINGVVYTSVVFTKTVRFYWDNILPDDYAGDDITMTAVFDGNTLTWVLRCGAWLLETDYKRKVKNTPFFDWYTNYVDVVLDAGKILFFQKLVGTNYTIHSTITGEMFFNLSGASKIWYLEGDINMPEPAHNDPRWLELELLPICSRAKLQAERVQFFWICRNGYKHLYFFDVIAQQEARGAKTEYRKKRQDAGLTVNYETSLSVPKVTKTYISYDHTPDIIKDIITLGSAMYVTIDGKPIDPAKFSPMQISANNKGLESISFSITEEILDTNSILW
jgi:hypothetical protein